MIYTCNPKNFKREEKLYKIGRKEDISDEQSMMLGENLSKIDFSQMQMEANKSITMMQI